MKIIVVLLIAIIFNAFCSKISEFFYGNLFLVRFVGSILIYCVVYRKKPQYAYYTFLIVVLFLRKGSASGYGSLVGYQKWWSLILKNRIVFVNVIGNILLFIPLGYYLSPKIFFLKAISIVFLIELMQYVLKKGIFDLVDIMLNMFGIVIGYLVSRWKKNERRQG